MKIPVVTVPRHILVINETAGGVRVVGLMSIEDQARFAELIKDGGKAASFIVQELCVLYKTESGAIIHLRSA